VINYAYIEVPLMVMNVFNDATFIRKNTHSLKKAKDACFDVMAFT